MYIHIYIYIYIYIYTHTHHNICTCTINQLAIVNATELISDPGLMGVHVSFVRMRRGVDLLSIVIPDLR